MGDAFYIRGNELKKCYDELVVNLMKTNFITETIINDYFLYRTQNDSNVLLKNKIDDIVFSNNEKNNIYDIIQNIENLSSLLDDNGILHIEEYSKWSNNKKFDHINDFDWNKIKEIFEYVDVRGELNLSHIRVIIYICQHFFPFSNFWNGYVLNNQQLKELKDKNYIEQYIIESRKKVSFYFIINELFDWNSDCTDKILDLYN